MRAREVAEDGGTTYVVVLDKGDEAVSVLTDFARRRSLDAAQVTAIGAFERAVLGWFDRKERDYRRIPVDEQVEVLSLVGDVASRNGEPQLHLHAVLGRPDGAAVGGHLLEGRVWPTLEVIVREAPGHLRKTYDEETGLALVDLGR